MFAAFDQTFAQRDGNAQLSMAGCNRFVNTQPFDFDNFQSSALKIGNERKKKDEIGFEAEIVVADCVVGFEEEEVKQINKQVRVKGRKKERMEQGEERRNESLNKTTKRWKIKVFVCRRL